MAAVAAIGFAAPKAVEFGGMEVQLKVLPAPVVEFRSKTSLHGNVSNKANREWIAIIVSFVPGVGKKGHVKALRGGWVDDVTLDVAVEVPMDGSGGRQKTAGLFTGSCKFWSIPLDGKPHTALMFIAPQLLDRYLPLNGGKYTEKLFRAQAIFRASDGAELGSAYFNFNDTPKKQALYFATLASETVIKDAVFPREKTPWALIAPGNYDLVKE